MKRRTVLLAAASACMAIQQDTVSSGSSEAGLTSTQTVSGRVCSIFSDGFELEYFDPAAGRVAERPFVWNGKVDRRSLCRVEYRQEGYGFFAQKVTPYGLQDIRYAVVAAEVITATRSQAKVLIVIDDDEYTQILDLPRTALRTISQGAVLYLDPENRIVRVEMADF